MSHKLIKATKTVIINQRLLQKAKTITLSQTENELPLFHKLSKEEVVEGTSSPNKSFKRLGTLAIDSESHSDYQKIAQKRVIGGFLLFLIILLERIFSDNLRIIENEWIISLQDYFGIASGSRWFLDVSLFFGYNLNFYLLMAHFFVFLYYYVNPVTCLKVMHVTLNLLIITSILEIFYEDPRPFWESDKILGIKCKSSYGFPSMDILGSFFLYIYSRYCFRKGHDDTSARRKSWFIGNILAVILIMILCATQILAGLAYISQTVVIMMYATLAYSLSVFFDKSLTTLIEKSSIDIQAAKRYTIFWFIYLMIFGGITIIIYTNANFFLDIKWIENYINCLGMNGGLKEISVNSPYHLIGPWWSFFKDYGYTYPFGCNFWSCTYFQTI